MVKQLRELLGHERFMVITDAIKLQILSSVDIEKAKAALKTVKDKSGEKDVH